MLYELLKLISTSCTEAKRNQFGNMEATVVLKKCRGGLGMKICGGQTEDGSYTGIFVKKIMLGGAVASDGTLEEGDRLLSANGESLMNCNNDKAVAILKNAAQTGNVKIVFRRDSNSRERLQRLFPSTNDSLYGAVRNRTLENEANRSLSRSDSMSSRISNASFEKRGWIYNGDRMSPAPLKETQSQDILDLMEKHELTRMEALDIPLSPQGIEVSSRGDQGTSSTYKSMLKQKSLISDLERVSSFDSGLPSSGRFSSPEYTEKGLIDSFPLLTIEIPAKTNLGISINGGKNKPDGPHIYVKDVIEGCDAYVDGRLRNGDRIFAINGESFNDVTYEQARSILMRLKLQRNLSIYKVTYSVNPDHINTEELQSMSLPATDAQTNRNPQHLAEPSTEMHSFSNHSLHEESSPNNFESIISQSSDEEAVARELIKMMEQSDYYEESLTKGNSLNFPREPLITNGTASNHPSEQSGTRDSRLINPEDVSPALERGSIFNPGEASSPEERHGNGNPYQSPAFSERKTISQYLEEDMQDTYTLKELQSDSRKTGKPGRRSRGRRLSLDPTTKIKVEKLEVALKYLGYDATPSKIRDVRKRVGIDQSGSVTYGDFVDAAREVFDLQLDDRTRTLNASSLQFAMRDIEAMERTDISRQQQTQPPQQMPAVRLADSTARLTMNDIEAIEKEEALRAAKRNAEHLAEMQGANRRIQDDLARVSRERDDALRELQYLRRELNEKNQSSSDIEDQLNRSRQEVANAYREVGELRTRTHLVSTALQEAKQREQKYEEKIDQLKNEVDSGQSKNNNVGPKQKEFNDLQKRMVVLGCQLRKTEVSKRTYEVAVEKLTKFAERVHDAADNAEKTSNPGSRRNSVSRSRSPINGSLAQEARDTVKAVKLLLEEEPLPFGWEEVYAPDGVRYYINHVTQTTSWLHPVSGVQYQATLPNGNAAPPLDQKF